jgi:hypothetical protein
MRRWIALLIAIIIGLGIGLYYGWVVSPVEYVDNSPDSLSADYRTDYVLMVAETFQLKQDPALAARQLGMFGSRKPAEIAAEALAYATQLNYASDDLQKMQALMLALQAYPSGGGQLP